MQSSLLIPDTLIHSPPTDNRAHITDCLIKSGEIAL